MPAFRPGSAAAGRGHRSAEATRRRGSAAVGEPPYAYAQRGGVRSRRHQHGVARVWPGLAPSPRHGCLEAIVRPQPLIAVTDVEASSLWYQRLLACESAHGGAEYERLVARGRLVMQLHRFEVDHHHGPIAWR